MNDTKIVYYKHYTNFFYTINIMMTKKMFKKTNPAAIEVAEPEKPNINKNHL